MSNMDSTVEVLISRETAGVEQKAFGVALILGSTKAFTTSTVGRWRVREYADTDAVEADFISTSPEAIAATAYFSQSPKPSKVMIGQRWTGDTTIADSITACISENSGWYGLIVCSRIEADVVAAATKIEAGGERVFVTASADPTIIDATDTDSLIDDLKGFDRTFVMYHSTAASAFPDAGAFGAIATMQPGEYTMNLQKIGGLTPDKLTDTQKGTAKTRKISVYTVVGGLNVLQGGAMAAGEWFDVIVFADWLKARIQETTFGIMARGKKKIPFTDSGFATLENGVRKVLSDGVDVGGLSEESFDEDGNQTGGFSITVKDAADVPFNDKAARHADVIKFVGWLAGAIHTTTIRGTITY